MRKRIQFRPGDHDTLEQRLVLANGGGRQAVLQALQGRGAGGGGGGGQRPGQGGLQANLAIIQASTAIQGDFVGFASQFATDRTNFINSISTPGTTDQNLLGTAGATYVGAAVDGGAPGSAIVELTNALFNTTPRPSQAQIEALQAFQFTSTTADDAFFGTTNNVTNAFSTFSSSTVLNDVNALATNLSENLSGIRGVNNLIRRQITGVPSGSPVTFGTSAPAPVAGSLLADLQATIVFPDAIDAETQDDIIQAAQTQFTRATSRLINRQFSGGGGRRGRN